ncbi:DUF2199 domain-containing protein [Mucilaginibacter sp. AW1-7]|uniref:DUF2199 domain-containing protein n=1 Tax=Mucilaginibacter sp. AW1-7 TaxID=3349874 RepID=UPI003F73CEEB
MLGSTQFTCSCCGKVYSEIPLCFDSDYPAYYFNVPENEVKERVEMAENLCVIDNYYFHKGELMIPINDHPKDLIFNVWLTITKENFEIRNTLWNDPERLKQEPYFGFLHNIVPTYDNTLGIKALACENNVGFTPDIVVVEENHPLRIDQLNGITLHEAVEKVQAILKDWQH